MSEIIDESLDYSVYNYNHSTLHFRNVAPQSAGDVTLSATSTSGPSSFVISSSVFNPAKSRITFELTFPDPGATVSVNWIQANLLNTISRITLYDQNTSAIWADINNVGNTYSMLSPAATKFEDFLHKSRPLNVLHNTAAESRLYPFEEIGKCGATNINGYNIDTAEAFTGSSNPGDLFQITNLIRGEDTEASYIQVSIPLSAFKHSIFSLDKMIYCPSNLQLDIYWAGFSTYAWEAASVTDPSSSPAALVSGTITGSQLLLQLCTEGNVNVASQVIQKTMSSGLSMPIGYVSSARYSITSTTSHSFTLPLTAAYGRKILYCAFSPFNATETLATSKIHSRNNSSNANLIDNYNSFINNVPILAPAGFQVATRGEDYIIANKQYLEGSVIQNVNDYIYNWVHVDNFARTRLCDLDPTQVDGLDVTGQQANYSMQMTAASATAFVWYVAVVGQKVLSISSQGSSVA
jgi:hypothetical protein